MSKSSVIKFFNDKHFEVDLIELEDSATVLKAAEAIGIKTNDIAKTLAFHVNNDTIVIVMSGDARVDNKKYKDYFGVKARMLSFDEVEPLTNHPVGGVCPFGLKDNVKIYLDESLKALEYAYPAAGSFDCALKIKISDLERLTEGTWINVCEIK